MVVVKYLCKGTGLANIPISNIPVCLLKNMVKKMKEKPTQPQKRKKPMDQMKHNLVVLLLLAKVQVKQIATEIQSADSITSNTKQPEEPRRRKVKQLKSNRLLIHDACSIDASVRLRCSAGLFNYDFALGIDFVKSNQPVGFTNF